MRGLPSFTKSKLISIFIIYYFYYLIINNLLIGDKLLYTIVIFKLLIH